MGKSAAAPLSPHGLLRAWLALAGGGLFVLAVRLYANVYATDLDRMSWALAAVPFAVAGGLCVVRAFGGARLPRVLREVALFGFVSAIAFLLFRPMWGDFSPWKVCLAMALLVGLGISFGVGAEAPPAERHRAQADMLGRPVIRGGRGFGGRRRAVMLLTGLVLVAMGVSIALDADLVGAEFRIGGMMALVVLFGVGGALIGVARTSSPNRTRDGRSPTTRAPAARG